MADVIKTLGQSQPQASMLTDLCFAPLGTAAVLSTLFVCNQGSTCGHFWVSKAVAGAADALSQYIYFQTEVFPYSTFPITCGITLGSTDVLRVKSDNGQISFTADGTRIAPAGVIT